MRARNILLAWEYGQNLGHMARLTELGRISQVCGFDTVWALPARYLHTFPQNLPAALHTRCVMAPQIAAPTIRPPVHSFADILATLGYTHKFALQNAVTQWLNLFQKFKIEHVILDYAPTAQLAAALVNLPATQITNGFDSPPADCPLFGIGMRGPMLMTQKTRTIDFINESFAQVAKSLNLRKRPALHDVLSYPTRLFDCIPEMDPYGPRKENAHYIGPILKTSDSVGAVGITGATVVWPPKTLANTPNIFIYVRDQALCIKLIEAIQEIPTLPQKQIICFAPTATPQTIQTLSRGNVCISTRPVHLPQILPACDLVMTYGAASTSAQALLAGVPLLVLPQDVEKQLMANRMAQAGAGLFRSMHSSKAQLLEAVQTLLREPQFKLKAEAIKDEYAHLTQHSYQSGVLSQFIRDAC